MPPSSVYPSSGMSSVTKVVVVVVVLAVLGGVYYWYVQSQSAPVAAVTKPAAPVTPSPAAAVAPANTDSSDAGLIQDSAAVDAQLARLGTDNTNMSASDQAVTQSY